MTQQHTSPGGALRPRALPEARGDSGARRRLALTPYLFTAPAVLILVALIVGPIIYALTVSFGTTTGGRAFEWAGIDNYLAVLNRPDFWNATGNTLVFTLTSVGGQFLLGLTAALALDQIQSRIGIVIRPMFIIPWAVMPVVVATVWTWIYNPQGGLLDGALVGLGIIQTPIAWLGDPNLAMSSVIVANLWRGTPFVTLMLYAALQGVSRDLYEAAALDGAGWTRIIRSITLPTIRPVIGVVLLLDLVWNFKLFDLNQIMTGGGPQGVTDILPTLIYRLAFHNGNFGEASAVAMLLLILTVVLTSAMSLAGMGSPVDKEES